MTLNRRIAYFLIGVAIWNVLTYGMFIRNLANTEGRPTGYYVAHTVLIVVNLAIAAVLGTLGWRALQGRSRSFVTKMSQHAGVSRQERHK